MQNNQQHQQRQLPTVVGTKVDDVEYGQPQGNYVTAAPYAGNGAPVAHSGVQQGPAAGQQYAPPNTGNAQFIGGPLDNTSMPPDYYCLSLLALIMFWPLGLVAIVFSCATRRKFVAGDREAAWKSARFARAFGIASIALGLVTIAIALAATRAGYGYGSNNRRGYYNGVYGY